MTPLKSSLILLAAVFLSQYSLAGNGMLGVTIKKRLEKIKQEQAIGNEDSVYSADVSFYAPPTVAGTGCNAQDTSITLSPDNKKVSILFSNFVNELDGVSAIRAKKNCLVRVPIKVPQGLRLSIVRIDYRGFNALPLLANTNLQSIVSYVNAQNNVALKAKEQFNTEFRGPINEDYFLGALFPKAVYSQCGQNVVVEVNNSLETVAKPKGETVFSSIDSLDVDASPGQTSAIHLKWQKCNCKIVKGKQICPAS